jgi:hypothetical protein
MRKDFIVSKTEAPHDGSHYVLVAFTDPNALKSTGGGGSGEAVPFTFLDFKITMKEYEDMAIKVGDKVRIEIKKAGNSRV